MLGGYEEARPAGARGTTPAAPVSQIGSHPTTTFVGRCGVQHGPRHCVALAQVWMGACPMPKTTDHPLSNRLKRLGQVDHHSASIQIVPVDQASCRFVRIGDFVPEDSATGFIVNLFSQLSELHIP
jgi:hypothetical protein